MWIQALIIVAALFVVIRAAGFAILYATELAESFRLSKYTIGFLIVAVISILPETFIAVNASLTGSPSLGLGMLFGSNVADLTLVFALVGWVASRAIKVDKDIVEHTRFYPLLLLFPIILGADGYFSRLEGAVLIVVGAAFYYTLFRNDVGIPAENTIVIGRFKSLSLLIVSLAAMMVGSHFTVTSATSLAEALSINPILIGMFIVGLGTTMPELFFSLEAVKRHDDSLAVGDLLGTVLADATIVVGFIALIRPFHFPQRIIFVTGLFMVGASILLLRLMRSGHRLTVWEAGILFVYYLVFVFTEWMVAEQ